MINSVYSNKESFTPVEFGPGMNVVLAERTSASSRQDSRNGLGKSTLIEVIHFCLGANTYKNKGLMVSALEGWEFSLDFDLAGCRTVATRGVDNSNVIKVTSERTSWPIPPVKENDCFVFGLKEWTTTLGHFMFGLPLISSKKYSPTFRALIPYFVRRGRDAYIQPFEHTRKQPTWQKQVYNAFLLGLSWEDSQKWQTLRDRKKALEAIRKASGDDFFERLTGELGELEADRVRLANQIAREKDGLSSYKVSDNYREIEKRVNKITRESQSIVNKNISSKNLLESYEKSLEDEVVPEGEKLDRMYSLAGVELPGLIKRRFDEVKEFHENIVKNRQSFLAREVDALRARIRERNESIETLAKEKASLMRILNTHGAIDEYTKMHEDHFKNIARLEELETQIADMKKLKKGQSQIKIDIEILGQKAMQDLEERKEHLDEAIRLFNDYSQNLYNAPGRLVVSVENNGLELDVDIRRSGSQGVDCMKIFCYDLTLANIWSKRSPSPGFLVHDSTIFDGVDERQFALAIELAAQESQANDYQYICALNSDVVPCAEFSNTFEFNEYVAAVLTDRDISGSLLGISF